jgi:hypothetical protein
MTPKVTMIPSRQPRTEPGNPPGPTVVTVVMGGPGTLFIQASCNYLLPPTPHAQSPSLEDPDLTELQPL